jgi:hypothetical protein
VCMFMCAQVHARVCMYVRTYVSPYTIPEHNRSRTEPRSCMVTGGEIVSECVCVYMYVSECVSVCECVSE